MSEVSAPVAGNIVSRGGSVPAQPVFVKPENIETLDTGAGTEGQEGEIVAPAGAAPNNVEANPWAGMTDEDLGKILEGRGIKVEGGLDGLKKLATTPASTEVTIEEKEKAAAAMEKRMIDFFMAGGGKAEEYVALKQIASADLRELSQSEIIRELKAADFSDDQIKEVLRERYYQINPEELTQGEDETEEEFTVRKALVEKKIAFGSKKLESKSSFIKKQAENSLGTLRKAIEQMDLQNEEEATVSSKVDEIALKLPRKFTFELGEVNGLKLDPVEFNVTDADIAPIVATLKDPEKRNNILFNKDNSLNYAAIAEILLKNQILESTAKALFLEGGNRQVATFEKRFPGRTPQDIGVGGASGGASSGRKGHIVSRGAAQPVNR